MAGAQARGADAATLRDLRVGDAGWVLEAHARHYTECDGFDASFEALVARVLAHFLAARDPETDRAWIAEAADGRRLGCVFCQRAEADTLKLRLFLVLEPARGTGLGRRLLAAVLAHARTCGFARVRVATHESHRAAGRLYAAAGFALVSSRPVTAFGQALVEQVWELPLTARPGLAIDPGRG